MERGVQESVMFSWYDVALRLRLPELLEQNRTEDSVLSNLVSALIKESSVRNRRAPEVTISGLAIMPKTTTLPALAVPDQRAVSPQTSSPARHRTDDYRPKLREKDTKPLIPKRLPENNFERYSSKPSKASMENWIPEDIRMRAIQRNILFAKETLEGTLKLENNLQREMKRLMVSDLERAKMEESLDATRKSPCGCCTQEFLYCNLPMKVSRKAIVDIRIKWSGQLNSSNVFRGNIRELLQEEASTSSISRTIEGDGQSGSVKKKGHSTNASNPATLDSVPQCYDQVGVCVFCAQFFQEPEEYRPSYAMITYEERKAAYFEQKRKEREYWDPLKMVEADRQRLEELGIPVDEFEEPT